MAGPIARPFPFLRLEPGRRRQDLDLVRMARRNHRPVPPFEPPAHADALPGKLSEIETCRLEPRQAFPFDHDGEVAVPILGEVHVEKLAPLTHRVNRAFHELISCLLYTSDAADD